MADAQPIVTYESVEAWKPIDGCQGYDVSSAGMVRSPRSGGMILKFCLVGNGYRVVTLRRNGIRKKHYIHALVCEAFHGDRPLGMQVNHKDGNRENNAADNLEWVTRSQNHIHAITTGLRTMIEPLRGADHPRSKLTQEQADSIRQIYANERIGMRKLAKRFGVDRVVVKNILSGRSYRIQTP